MSSQTTEERMAEVYVAVARRAALYERRDRVAEVVRDQVEKFGVESLEVWVLGWIQSVVADDSASADQAMARIAAVLAAANTEREKAAWKA